MINSPKILSLKQSKSNLQKQPSEVFYEKRVLENFANFTGKHLRSSVVSMKLQANDIEKKFQYRCFPVKFVRFLRTPI